MITTDADSPRSVAVGDVDGDDDLDVVIGGNSNVVWYENTDGQGSVRTAAGDYHPVWRLFPWTVGGLGWRWRLGCPLRSTSGALPSLGGPRTLTVRAVSLTNSSFNISDYGAASVTAGDLDSDGDLDVLLAHELPAGNRIAWYQNVDGRGNLGPPQPISNAAATQSVTAGDFDGDGDLDVLSTPPWGGDTTAWYANTDGAGSFGPRQVITTSARVVGNSVGDMDGDGDLDVVLGVGGPGSEIAWYENSDGAGTFGGQRLVYRDFDGWLQSLAVADLDGDGDVDVLSASVERDANCLVRERRWSRQLWLAAIDYYRPCVYRDAIAVADLDRRRRPRRAFCGGYGPVAWYENTDGAGQPWIDSK